MINYARNLIRCAPIEGSTVAEEHYYNQTNLTNSIPKHHMIIECGEFNAHLRTGSVLTFLSRNNK